MSSNLIKPEHILKRANDLINSAVGTNAEKEKRMACKRLHQVISLKRKGIWTRGYEDVMKRHIELCVDLKDHLTAKDGLHQYRNLCFVQEPSSLHNVIIYLLDLSEDRALKARQKADRVSLAAAARICDLEQEESPESIMLSSMTEEGSKERTDRELVVPWLRFLWENYRSVLELLYKLPKMEKTYHEACRRSFKFCIDYSRTIEFRRLCEMLRTQLVNLQKGPSSIALGWSSESIESHLQTRFAQLDVAVKMDLWNEAFRTIEDIHCIMSINKKATKLKSITTYYEKLAQIFWVAQNKLFHAYALLQLFVSSLELKKDWKPEERNQLAGQVLVAALTVPSIKDIYAAVVEEDEVVVDRSSSVAKLLDFQSNPTRQNLLSEIASRGVLEFVSPELKNLYQAMEVNFKPLSMTSTVVPIVDSLRNDQVLSTYVSNLERIVVIKLLQQLSRVYTSVRLEFVHKLLAGLKGLTPVHIEKIILEGIAHKQLQLKISHSARTIVYSNATITANALDNQATQLGSVLSKVSISIASAKSTPSKIEDQKKSRREFLVKVQARLNEEVQALAERKMLIEKRKEEIEKQQSDNVQRLEDTLIAEREKRLKEEAERIAHEESERLKAQRYKEQEKVIIADIVAKLNAIEKSMNGKLKVAKTEAEVTALSADQRNQLVPEAQSKRDKMKEVEALQRTRSFRERHIFTCACRLEEAPKVLAREKSHEEADKAYLDMVRVAFAESFKAQHEANLLEKARFEKMQDHRANFEANILIKQKADYERMIAATRKKMIQDAREKRWNDAKAARAAEVERMENEKAAERARIEEQRLELERQENLRKQRDLEAQQEAERARRAASEAEALAKMKRQLEELEKKPVAPIAASRDIFQPRHADPRPVAAPRDIFPSRQAEPRPVAVEEPWRRASAGEKPSFEDKGRKGYGNDRSFAGGDRGFSDRAFDKTDRGGFGGERGFNDRGFDKADRGGFGGGERGFNDRGFDRADRGGFGGERGFNDRGFDKADRGGFGGDRNDRGDKRGGFGDRDTKREAKPADSGPWRRGGN